MTAKHFMSKKQVNASTKQSVYVCIHIYIYILIPFYIGARCTLAPHLYGVVRDSSTSTDKKSAGRSLEVVIGLPD